MLNTLEYERISYDLFFSNFVSVLMFSSGYFGIVRMNNCKLLFQLNFKNQ